MHMELAVGVTRLLRHGIEMCCLDTSLPHPMLHAIRDFKTNMRIEDQKQNVARRLFEKHAHRRTLTKHFDRRIFVDKFVKRA